MRPEGFAGPTGWEDPGGPQDEGVQGAGEPWGGRGTQPVLSLSLAQG